MVKKSHKKKFIYIPTIIIAAVIAAVVFLPAGFFILFSGRIYPGVAVLKTKVGNKTLASAQQQLENTFSRALPDKILVFDARRSWKIKTATIGANIDSQKTAEQAFSYGRKGTIFGNIQAIARSSLFGVTIAPVLNLHEQNLVHVLADIANEIDVPAEESTISIDPASKKIVVSEGKDGRSLRIDATVGKIKNQLINLHDEPVELIIQPIRVKASKDMLEKTRARGENLLRKSIGFRMDETTVEVGGEDLVNLLDFSGSYNRDKVASLAAFLASRVDKNPQDAAIQFEGDKVKVFRPSQDGLALDQLTAIPKIIESAAMVEATTSASLEAGLPLIVKPPRISTAQVNNLGIKERLGKGISYFRGSIASRIHNIVLASSRVNGTLVPPGETFSFAKAVGDISAATGYQQAYIIEKGRTVLGDGGGTCQVSTTLFRAILDAGLPVEERHAHAYRVSYYEQGGWDPGFDATVFVPTVDLKFTNDTPAYILVQATPNPQTATLIFELYGTKDKRTVTIGKARVWDRTPAPPDRYEDDPTLAKGVVKQVDWAAAGAKAAFDYEVKKDGQVIQQRTFFSNFRPWQAVFLRGTKD